MHHILDKIQHTVWQVFNISNKWKIYADVVGNFWILSENYIQMHSLMVCMYKNGISNAFQVKNAVHDFAANYIHISALSNIYYVQYHFPE